jgi:hypothetical protein
MTTTRTHFTFRVDTWTPDGESIVEYVFQDEGGRCGRRSCLGLRLASPASPQALNPIERIPPHCLSRLRASVK